ncbi:2-hydroxychromene-2-carboxylate isomerase [Allosediminivita pacifica]|uniref:2-hydroxychromene-2-carboxylate isomerase n=1 Tax=Allosediminivita pacifica TaxID=1267769 RepID=A0A2T6AYF6_9RHOB|nr:2-hydroxychromene-2-carboxylate isomerase [Allosediminivita pacifica]PTX48836.1 2-hydroxychromene-2-carboxylate isomerase [Allosediminivita pacifica]GGB08668.1 2-hydroxychromene-2-carboxylate isomerase [Allosediminivita pacifica]
MAHIDFWYAIGSTYSYLTIMRLPDLAAAEGLDIIWRPFDVRHVMTHQNNIPFKDKPVKAAYMWRDIERRAEGYGLPHAHLPAPYPLKHFALANRLAVLGMRQGWGVAYTRAAYRLWFLAGHPPGEEPNNTEALEAAGVDPLKAVAEAESAKIGKALQVETDLAMDLGVFGAPSFVVDGEVFWGDDRLEDAISWLHNGRVTLPQA